MNNNFTVVKNYVDSKIELTKCMQKHFRQVCHNCRKYVGCSVYSNYTKAWFALQRIVELSEKE